MKKLLLFLSILIYSFMSFGQKLVPMPYKYNFTGKVNVPIATQNAEAINFGQLKAYTPSTAGSLPLTNYITPLTDNQVVVAKGDSAVKSLVAGAEGFTLQIVGGVPAWAAAGVGDMVLTSAQTNTGAKTFATGSLISTDITGGTAVGSKITYKSTTGAGTTAGIAHQFVGGTDGATVLATILNNGNVGFGTIAPTAQLSQKSTSALESGVLSAELLAGGGWTSTDWTGTNPFTHTTGNVSVLSNTFAAVINTYYQITYTITGRTAGTVVIALGGQSIASVTVTGAFGPRATSTGNFTVTPTTDFDGTITLSVKSISPYGATYNILDNAGIANIEIRSSLVSLNNTFIGKNAGSYNTTGSYNTAQGANALQNNTTGFQNSAQGMYALYSNTTGYQNSAQGMSALYSNTTGFQNSAQGMSTLYSNTTGNYNSAQGYQALYSNTTGNYNYAQGVQALYSNTTGYFNSAQGASALYLNTTGFQNSAQGVNAGRSIIDGNSNTFVGYSAGYNASQKTNAANSMALGNGTWTTANDQVIIGNASVNVGIAQTIPTARLHLPAGTATANTAPLKFTSGVLNTTPEAGAVEYNGTNFFATNSTAIRNILLTDKKSGFDTAPASATGTGTAGEVRITATYIYVCTVTNTWVRTALTTW